MEVKARVTRVADERIVVSRPLGEDAVYIYKIRYTTETQFDEKGSIVSRTYRSYYGGIDGTWNEFEPYEKLDLEARGVLSMHGQDWWMLRQGITELDETEKNGLREAYRTLSGFFGPEDIEKVD